MNELVMYVARGSHSSERMRYEMVPIEIGRYTSVCRNTSNRIVSADEISRLEGSACRRTFPPPPDNKQLEVEDSERVGCGVRSRGVFVVKGNAVRRSCGPFALKVLLVWLLLIILFVTIGCICAKCAIREKRFSSIFPLFSSLRTSPRDFRRRMSLFLLVDVCALDGCRRAHCLAAVHFPLKAVGRRAESPETEFGDSFALCSAAPASSEPPDSRACDRKPSVEVGGERCPASLSKLSGRVPDTRTSGHCSNYRLNGETRML